MKINGKKIKMQSELISESARTDLANGLDDFGLDMFESNTIGKNKYQLNNDVPAMEYIALFGTQLNRVARR